MKPVFLSADWHQLVMLNFSIEPAILEPFVPRGTVLDAWQGTTYVSLVAFSFLNTKLKGIPIPFHRNFEEINLRFYVRAEDEEGSHRGVVFIKEVVPRAAIAKVARVLYNENYVTCPTRSSLVSSQPGCEGEAMYHWKHAGDWLTLGATYEGEPAALSPGSEAEFIAEHYWGYSKQRNGGTVKYRVEHPPWRVWSAKDYTQSDSVANFYGPTFASTLKQKPSSVFIAEGSGILVRGGERIC